ncbi:uncharacterized protein LOC135394258 [Ornithodoros turicata]|uniref:uncharacterized protein LOC135394258 n=1 Tax=Ornithodoros turicata TaxID=34597 RepID=UPI003138BAEC
MRRGRPRKNRGESRQKYRKVSAEDRARIIDCARRRGDLKQVAAALGINIKTARSIARRDRTVLQSRGGSKIKFSEVVRKELDSIVDEYLAFTLNQLKCALQGRRPGLEISTWSIDRLLDRHSYPIKLLTLQPQDRNTTDVKETRKTYAQRLQVNGPQVLRYYIDETNFNVCCSRSFGRSKQGAPAVEKRTSTKGANINVVACMSANALFLWRLVEPVSWLTFNEFLQDAFHTVMQLEPEANAVFIFDNAPCHKHSHEARLQETHVTKYLPLCSPFFNPIEEMFAKFKLCVKAFLGERSAQLLETPAGTTKKQHRKAMLTSAAQDAMQKVLRVDCTAYDRDNFKFVSAALEGSDM